MNDSKYIVDPNGERRAGCFGNAIRYGVGGGIIALLLWVLFGMVGCKSVQISDKVNVRDSVAIRYQDSIRCMETFQRILLLQELSCLQTFRHHTPHICHCSYI